MFVFSYHEGTSTMRKMPSKRWLSDVFVLDTRQGGDRDKLLQLGIKPGLKKKTKHLLNEENGDKEKKNSIDISVDLLLNLSIITIIVVFVTSI